MHYTTFLAVTLVLVFCGCYQAQQIQCLQLKEQNRMYGYSLGGRRKKSVFYPLAQRVGTQNLEKDLGSIKLYNKKLAIIELAVSVALPESSDGKATLKLEAMHTDGGCADFTENDCVTNVPESEYPMWAVCQDFQFTLKPPGLTLDMRLRDKFLVVTVKGEVVAKVALPPVACMPNAIRHRVTRIAYKAGTSPVKPFICQ